MRDLFDEFMEELRRRQRAAAGNPDESTAESESGPNQRAATDDEAPGDDRPTQGDDDRGDEAGSSHSEPDEGEPGAAEGDEATEEDGAPVPIRRASAGGGGGPRGPRSPSVGGPNDGSGGRRRRRLRDRLGGIGIVIAIVIVIAIITTAGAFIDLVTDAIWFKSIGFDAVFWTRIGTQAFLFIGVFAFTIVVLGANLWIAGRLAPPPGPAGEASFGGVGARLAEAFGAGDGRPPWSTTGGPWRIGGDPRSGRMPGGRGNVGAIAIETPELPDMVPILRWALVALAVIITLGTAAGAASNWETYLLWQNQVPFSTTGTAVVDPVFHHDISFYLFQLPFLRLLQSTFNGLMVAGLILSIGRYVVGAARGGLVFTTRMRVHLAVLGGLFLLSAAAGYQLDKLELVYSTQGIALDATGAVHAVGVAYTDQNARFLAFDVLTAISAFAGCFLVIGAFTRQMWPLGAIVVVWFSASVILGSLFPYIVQRLQVEPDQLGKETPFIGNNVAMTRLAFAINGWQSTNYGGAAPLTASAVQQESSTFQNARLWDYRPLQDTLDQLQTVRQYYDFADVDTDRYVLNGTARQVMLSARELAPEKNPQGGTWVNQRITFTHGIGVAMVPVNQATAGGQPELIVKDLPPVSSDGAPPITKPWIYFGERVAPDGVDNWVITGARQDEFDYPLGTSDQAGSPTAGKTTRWTGTTGIKLDTTMSRLLFAMRFKDLNLLISDQVTADSQLLFHRTLADRLQMIAPFLKYDSDPYLVVNATGGLDYVQDAYTTSDRFPNAQSFDPTTLGTTGLGDQPINYIRNSVKIVMDAYTGQMTFYVSDPSDPIIRTYEKVFPTLFTPLSAMTADLRAHLRVPEELFNVQTRTYARYHVTDPAAFFNGEDVWTVPANPGGTQSLPNEAYYVEMRMPGEPSSEFLLLQPMVPSNRPNMIAWIAARNDGQNYGTVRVYRFPQDTSVLGPTQIEAKIDADPIISAQVSLWDQAGSKVIRGNLIVVPIQDSLIYLQPVYLQSQNSPFPEFQRIIVATPSKIVWGSTLAEALNLVLAGGGGQAPSPPPSSGPGTSPSPTPSAGPGTTPTAGDVSALIAYANSHFELAQAALRNGDFATYGTEIAKVQDALRELAALAPASALPGPSGSPSPAP